MYSCSEAFHSAVRDGRPSVAYADLYKNFQLLASDLPVSGSITLDETAASRRSFNGTIIPTEDQRAWIPKSAADAFTPYGSELLIRVGYRLPSGITEFIPAATIRLEDVETDGYVIGCSGPDRSVVISEGRPEKPYIIKNGTNLGTAIQDILNTRLNGLDYSLFGITNITLGGPIVLEETSDLWQEAQDLAASNGYELFFEQRGRPVFRAKPDPVNATSVWTYAPGPDKIYLGGKRKFSSQGLRNVWVAKGDPGTDSTSVRASSEITDPSNPLFPAGGFGRRPEFFASQYLTTVSQCQKVADAFKAQKAGLGDSFKFQAVPHPGHDPGDVAEVKDAKLGVGSFFALRSWDLDLSLHSEVEFETRSRRNS